MGTLGFFDDTIHNGQHIITLTKSMVHTLAARGLEEPRNCQELSVGPVHFPDLSCLYRNI